MNKKHEFVEKVQEWMNKLEKPEITKFWQQSRRISQQKRQFFLPMAIYLQYFLQEQYYKYNFLLFILLLSMSFAFTSFETKNTKLFSQSFDAASIEVAKKMYSNNRKGWCVIGLCKNQNCEYFDRWAWSCLGEGTFDIQRIIHNILCPFCNAILSNTNKYAAIFDCLMLTKGRTVGSREEKVFEELIDQPNTYMTFGQGESQPQQWEELVLKITTPKKCMNSHNLGKFKKCYTQWTCSNCKHKGGMREQSKFCPVCRYHLCWNCV